jgi:CheY-like chemotaxis protein
LLVVDDDPEVLAVLLRQLTRAGFAPICCATIEEANERLAAETFTCVLVDLYFGFEPKGWDLIKTIRNNPRTAALPVVSMSGSGLSLLGKCLDYGADAVLSKPFILPEFLEALRQAVAARETEN